MKGKFFLAALCIFIVGAVKAQEAQAEQATPPAADQTVSDDELQRYAVMMDSIDEMRVDLLADITQKVRSNSKITVARYNELSKIAKDKGKLEDAKATPEEISFIAELQTQKDSASAEINSTYKALAKEYVGAATFNKVRKAINEDSGLKSKYETILNKLKEDNGG